MSHLPVLRRFLVSFFSAAALSTPAIAQDSAPPPVPDETAATRDLNGLRTYYDGLRADDAAIVLVDADSIDALDSANPDYAALARRIARGGPVVPEASSLGRILTGLRRSQGPYSADPRLRHELRAALAVLSSDPDGRSFCLAITVDPDHDPSPDLAGLTTAQKIRFFNRHEFWHCAGNQLPDRAGVDGHYAYLSEETAEETRADLGALADMVALDGDDPAIITAVAVWRASRSGIRHRSHLTTPTLLALADRIETMGLDAFRALSDHARRQLCLELAEQHRLSPATLAEIDRLQGLPYTDVPPLATDAEQDEARDVVALFQRLAPTAAATTPDGLIYLTPAQMQEALTWDPAGRLAAQAAQTGSLNRQTLATARVRLLDSLRRDVLAEPANPVHGARIVLLEAAYQQALQAQTPPPRPAGGPQA